MDQPKDFEEPNDSSPPVSKYAGGAHTFPPSVVPGLTSYERLPEVEAELSVWYGLSEDQKQRALTEMSRGTGVLSVEALIHITRLAFKAGDRKTINLAFGAISKAATPLLMSQARKLPIHERQDQAQQILLHLFEAIDSDKADYAESRFASFALRASISLHRSRVARFEGCNNKIEATEAFDPVTNLPARVPSSEARAMLSKALDSLSPKLSAAFVQYHCFGLKQEEIAAHHGVDVRTIRNWLKAASDSLGLAGDSQ